MSDQEPPGVVSFGPDSNCNLSNCPAEWSIYGYRPSLAGNATFLALFVLIGMVHGYLGYRWRSWGFMVGMLLGFCLTIAPVFYTASIYVTLSKTILSLAPQLSRFNPVFFYWIFIPFDVVCLALQAAGGAMSTTSSGQDKSGVNISLAGLALQVIVLTAFAAFFADYMIRYVRSSNRRSFDWRLQAFFGGLVTSTLLILARCAYRVAELKDGYDGHLIREEAPFIGLEGVLIVLAAVVLCFGHPGLVFGRDGGARKATSEESVDVQVLESK
ncbi:hypothetical protein E4U11_004949 [Claviceps purpurea]|nr:hypothetical protein E4U11_004949 [Claviceps purpurea]